MFWDDKFDRTINLFKENKLYSDRSVVNSFDRQLLLENRSVIQKERVFSAIVNFILIEDIIANVEFDRRLINKNKLIN